MSDSDSSSESSSEWEESAPPRPARKKRKVATLPEGRARFIKTRVQSLIGGPFQSVATLAATKKLINEEIDKKIREIKELSNEYECPVCKRTAKEGRSFMSIDACKHVVCAACHVQILTKSMRDYEYLSRCPVCRSSYRNVTDLDMGHNKKVTELDIKQKIHMLSSTRAVRVDDSDSD